MVKRHKSAKGDQIDFDLLQLNNKEVVAIGNASMNANGDTLGRGGVIVRKVDDIPKSQLADPNAAYNQQNPKSTKLVSLKSAVVVDDVVVEATPEVVVEETVVDEIEKKQKSKRKIIDSEE